MMKKGFLLMAMASIFLSVQAGQPAGGSEEGAAVHMKDECEKITPELHLVVPGADLDEGQKVPVEMGTPDLVKEGALEIYWMEMKLKIFFA